MSNLNAMIIIKIPNNSNVKKIFLVKIHFLNLEILYLLFSKLTNASLPFKTRKQKYVINETKKNIIIIDLQNKFHTTKGKHK